MESTKRMTAELVVLLSFLACHTRHLLASGRAACLS